jgi:hypothetical protein
MASRNARVAALGGRTVEMTTAISCTGAWWGIGTMRRFASAAIDGGSKRDAQARGDQSGEFDHVVGFHGDGALHAGDGEAGAPVRGAPAASAGRG